jgi:hypothetical protein
MIQPLTLPFQGKRVNALEIHGRTFLVFGKFVKTASLKNEYQEDLDKPEETMRDLKAAPNKVDLLKFWQRVPETEPKFAYYKEWRQVAAIPLSTYQHWWEKQVNQNVRRNVKKATKQGVVISEVPFNDELVRGIVEIYNQSQVRQGTFFYHYGEDFETVKMGLGVDLETSIFVAAHYRNELIGFTKVIFTDRSAMVTMILDKMTHRDKSPMNGMLAKVVEICAERKVPFVTYCLWRRGGLAQFQKANGFVKFPVPEYFVPLTWKGWLALHLRLHKGLKALIPEWVIERCLVLRAKYYAIKYRQEVAEEIVQQNAPMSVRPQK